MTYEEALREFGLPASPNARRAIRYLLEEEIQQQRQSKGEFELLRTLCVQLFSIGNVEDSLLIWNAKKTSFDAMCGLDVQFLCGAGLEATKQFLVASSVPEAKKALEYIGSCEGNGFKDWTPAKTLAFHRQYYRLDPPEKVVERPKAQMKRRGRKNLSFGDFLKMVWRAR
jgi:hypothetical protein